MAKTTYTLEMNTPDRFAEKARSGSDLAVSQATEPYPELAKFFHTLVGHPWRWGGRDGWGESEWEAYVSQSGFEMWVGYWAGTPVGYFELGRHSGGDVQYSPLG